VRPDDLETETLHQLQRLPPRDEGRQRQVAERRVLMRQRVEPFAVDGDIAHRLVTTAVMSTVCPDSSVSSPRNPDALCRIISPPAASRIATSPSTIA
jgi:hypothetical protein